MINTTDERHQKSSDIVNQMLEGFKCLAKHFETHPIPKYPKYYGWEHLDPKNSLSLLAKKQEAERLEKYRRDCAYRDATKGSDKSAKKFFRAVAMVSAIQSKKENAA